LKKNNLKESYEYYYKSLEYGSIYRGSVRAKCYNGLKAIFTWLAHNDSSIFSKELEILTQMCKFYKREDRDFLFLVDSTSDLNNNLCDVMMLIKEICGKLFHDDYVSIYRYHQDIEEVMPFTKHSTIRKDGNRLFDAAFEKLKKNAKESRRYTYDCMLKAITFLKKYKPDNPAKYLIVITFGENQIYKRDDALNNSRARGNKKLNSIVASLKLTDQIYEQLLEAIEDSYIHYTMVCYTLLPETRLKMKKIIAVCKGFMRC